MTDSRQIPYLLKLLDDESADVRGPVLKALEAFGPGLEAALAPYAPGLDTPERRVLQRVIASQRRGELKSAWPSWQDEPNDVARLERAFSLLSAHMSGFVYGTPLGAMLDRLAADFRESSRPADPYALSSYLFRDRGLAGASEDYYRAENSDLAFVIRERRGLPISLACVFMLVGARLGLSIEGCNFPGHFMARFYDHGEMVLVDCFNGGQFIAERSLMENVEDEPPAAVEAVLREKTSAAVIVQRVLANLARAYEREGDGANAALMADLSDLQRRAA